ncbi:MAG: molybdopterin-dependent oxidoreductase [Acidobacteria bacterium]|nr:molybdopterin-dependent oxidoreductase [Acidobacteriota bacterium]
MSDIKRRDFLKIIGVTGTGAAMTGCSQAPVEKLIPYLVPPENIIPGVASWYATVCRECPAGCGMLVRTREGRAVKVEGNPKHPVNRGRLCIRGQASLQGLYNPDRIRQPLLRNPSGEFQPISWQEGEKLLAEQLGDLRRQGKTDKVALLTPPVTGSLEGLIQEWTAALGIKQRLIYEPFAYEPLRAANRITFGRDAIPHYKIEDADVLISFGADFLETWLSNVGYAHGFKEMHALRDGKMGRFIHVEPRLSLTAANADQWVPIQPGTEVFLALGMIHVILQERLASASLPRAQARRLQAMVRSYDPETVATRTGIRAEDIRRLARLFAQAERGLAIGGGVATSGRNATATAVAVNLLNYVAGNIGRTVIFGPDSSLGRASSFGDALKLTDSMARGEIEALLLFDVNPLFTLPRSSGFTEALEKVPFVVSFSSFLDETTARADLVLPSHTPLESWGDYEPRSGVHGLQQPVMQPVFDTKAVGDTLLSVAKQMETEVADKFSWNDFHAYLLSRWEQLRQRVAPGKDFPTFWEEALREGGAWKPAPSEPVRLSSKVFSVAFEEASFDGATEGALPLMVYPSLHHFDGRGANRPWLQEVPDPMTKVVWDNWVEIHPETAKRLGIERGDVVKLTSPYGSIELPALPYQGIHPEAVAVQLGQGHTEYGRYAQGRGANPIELLPAKPEAASGGLPWLSVKVQIAKTGRRTELVSTAGSDQQLGRDIAQVIPLAEALGPTQLQPEQEPALDMYPEHEHKDYRWGMAIDLNSCIGCNACVAACYAENNLPLVGKEQVAMRREMAWIRIERYFEEGPTHPQALFVPMLCQQCDNAPCEPVCPVYATYHNPEGLNVQVYNRCVGTRYCSNNCPYTVRRFNFYEAQWPKPLDLQLNPDVTARSKGVMEKCTFCIQRIQGAKDHAKDEDRKVQDGEATPACVQTCPTEAIVFGNLEDPNSRVAHMAQQPRRYHVLGELNTKPAITYLKKVLQKPVAG